MKFSTLQSSSLQLNEHHPLNWTPVCAYQILAQDGNLDHPKG